MSVHRIELHSCARPAPFNGVEQVLSEVAELEAAMALEVKRLSTMPAPRLKRVGVRRFRGRDIWWWRAMLVSWAYSLKTERAHPGDVLLGLRDALKKFSDDELRDFISRLPIDVSHLPPSA